MRRVSFLLLLAAFLAGSRSWAQNVKVVCTEYYSSSPPVVTVPSQLGSGSVTGNCTLQHAYALEAMVSATNNSICEISVTVPSTVGPHQFNWNISYFEGRIVPQRRVGGGTPFIWKPNTNNNLFIYVGGQITLAQQEGTASANITIQVKTISGSCSFGYSLQHQTLNLQKQP